MLGQVIAEAFGGHWLGGIVIAPQLIEGIEIPALPVTQLHSKAPLHFASPFCRATYTRTVGFCLWPNSEFQRVTHQNPPVLLSLEMVCFVRLHPPFSASGRKRYHTPDFAGKVVCHEITGFFGFFPPRMALPSIGFPRQQGAPRPYWKPRANGKSRPFGIPARYEMSTHKQEKIFGCLFQNAIIPRTSSGKEMKSWGFWVLRAWNSRDHSCVTFSRNTYFEICFLLSVFCFRLVITPPSHSTKIVL